MCIIKALNIFQYIYIVLSCTNWRIINYESHRKADGLIEQFIYLDRENCCHCCQ